MLHFITVSFIFQKYPQSLEIPEDEIYYFQETLKMDKVCTQENIN